MGRIDLTIGSALDIFGGTGVKYDELVAFNREKIATFQRFTDSTL
jgi:phosphoribosylformimino-5-aminoimidazole carboxamide ribotide isomerase